MQQQKARPETLPELVPVLLPSLTPPSPNFLASQLNPTASPCEPSVPGTGDGCQTTLASHSEVALTEQQKRKICENKDEALRRKKLRKDNDMQQASSEDLLTPKITAEQRARSEHNKKEAQMKLKRRTTGKTRAVEEEEPLAKGARYDPFGEFHDDDNCGNPEIHEDCFSRSEESCSVNGISGSATPAIKKAAKHALASEKLLHTKLKANETWREHLNSSTRLSQLLGSEPSQLADGEGDQREARFKVHSSHRTMALRSIVFCKACGYWGAKKSQKLQLQCKGKPQHHDAAHKLKRMSNGLHPEPSVKSWPDGHDARVPSHPVSVDWSSSV